MRVSETCRQQFVQQRECKTLNLKSVPLPATREEVYNACVAAFLEERSGEDLCCTRSVDETCLVCVHSATIRRTPLTGRGHR